MPSISGYDAWKLATPEEGRRVTATCRTCGTEHYSDPEYKVCATCQTLTCHACDRHVCDGCGAMFCKLCAERVAVAGGSPLWLCAECKVQEMLEQLPALEFDLSQAEVATLMGGVDRMEVNR